MREYSPISKIKIKNHLTSVSQSIDRIRDVYGTSQLDLAPIKHGSHQLCHRGEVGDGRGRNPRDQEEV